MKKANVSKLWIYFSFMVFTVNFIAFVIIAITAFVLIRLGVFDPFTTNPHGGIIFFLFISLFTGAVISLFVAKKILKPITQFSDAAREVAKGNFKILLQEGSRVTEIRELTHNFNSMIQELSSIETLRTDFIVNVSHEFKTPIAAIEGYAMLLQDKSISEVEREEYTQMIIDSSRQLTTLTGNILNLSKLENQELILEKTPFRFDEMIRQAVLMLETEWSKKRLDLQIDLAKITYVGNEKLLVQVCLNLIGNAVKFTQNGGIIDINLYAKDSEVIVLISDTGFGMSETVKKRIFDKFYQGDTARKLDGNGLGLALVKRIVDLCNGEITVDTEIGNGTTFKVILPIDKSDM